MAEMPELPEIALATFRKAGTGGGEPITVHFNPESLQYSVSNTLKDEGSGKKKKQYVDKTEAKLSMSLIFDTTHTGEDVRSCTDPMAALLQPASEGNKQVPPNVEFGWGAYGFTGMVESYKETLDFFSASGVPLRASIELTLASQDVQFDSGKNPNASVDGDLAGDTPVVSSAGGAGAAGLANQLGDPRAARAIASANGSASLRFGGEAGLAISAGIELKGEAAFSLGASGGLGAGAGLSLGVGAGASAGAGAGIGLDIGFGVGAGVSAGASSGGGVSTEAAFAGLRSTSASASVSLPSAASVFSASASIGAGVAGAGASFGVGGKAQGGGGGGLSADVGVEADLNALIRFG